MTKKITCIVIALAMIILSSIPAFAENNETDTEVLNHSYNAYQVFKAKGVDGIYLTGAEWGSMFGSADKAGEFLAALKADSSFNVSGANIFAQCKSAGEVAEVLSEYENYSDVAKAFANSANGYANNAFPGGPFRNGDTVSEAGYYLFKDAAQSGLANAVILKMAADSRVNIEAKVSVPQVVKKVKENTYGSDCESESIYAEKDGKKIPFRYGEGYNDVADYCIGDSVPFELIGTIPDNIGDYSEYYYAFRDTLSKGLTFSQKDAGEAAVFLYDISNGNYTRVRSVTDKFKIEFNVNDKGETELSFECSDILSAIADISSDSLLVVNYNAVLNENAIVGYDGNPNEVYLEYANNPNNPSSHGKTPNDKVIVFTYKLDVKKLDNSQKPLKGAEFYLINGSGEYYSGSSKESCWVKNEADAKLLRSDKDGLFMVRGLDKGEYTLREKNAPEGFKIIAHEIKFSIDAVILPDIDDTQAQNWTTAAKDALRQFTAKLLSDEEKAVAGFSYSDAAESTVDIDIVNIKVYDLPGTGGIGTTFFYVAGGVLVAAAIVMIIVKKRRSR